MFTIENTGNTDAIGKMQWSNLVNTYTLGSLTYTLSYSNAQAGVYTDIITNENVPKSATAVTEDLANGLSVPAGVKYYYKLVITLNSLDDVDQTSDITASFGTKFTMVQGTLPLNTHITSLTLADGVYNENGYRYEGANPNNYITFNNETWRIIGVFNTLLADGKVTKPLVKIIKEDSIGDYPFDNTTDISAFGLNAWERLDGTKATVNTLLNTYYYNSSDGSSLSLGNWTSTGLNETSRGLIEEVTWNLGGASLSSIPASVMYTAERTALSGTAATYNKSVTTGKIGLMYPSDYLYSVPESTCVRTIKMGAYSTRGCYSNSWIYKPGVIQWTLSPYSSSSDGVWIVNSSGYVNGNNANNGCGARPVLYLSSNAYIVQGDGTSGNPYVIER